MVTKSAHKIALYIRVSTEEQAQNPEGSIKNQEERLRAAVQLKNLSEPWGEIVGVFIDRGLSGKNTKRPELQRLLLAIERKEVTVVMVSELSRLSRSVKDFTDMKELMDRCVCGIYSLRESFDSTTAAGEMVMYIMANLAQFERRQVSERVAANFQARAARGLYNGGPVALGFKLIPEKPGFLANDEENASIVRMAFKTFIEEGTLAKAAAAMNANGYPLKRSMEGGSSRPRLGHFTCQNLRDILKNRAYIGVRKVRSANGNQEVTASWDPIVDANVFQQAQDLLKKSKMRKPESKNRYPYLLSGLTYCASCKFHMNGKSATGRNGKVPYYEHGWATKVQGCLVKKVFSCQPHRISGKKLEQSVWAEVEKLLTDPTTAEAILAQAKRVHSEKGRSSEIERHQAKISALESQLEALAERLSELPKTVSAQPIYLQMEKLEAIKASEKEKLQALKASEGMVSDLPASLTSYRGLLDGLNRLDRNPTAKVKIIQALIHKIEITPDGYRLHYYAGESRINRGLSGASENNSFFGSNSLKNGAR